MKTKKFLLATIFMLSATACQATGPVNTTASVTILAAIPCAYYLCKADGDIPKAKRLFRKDRDATLTDLVARVHKNCQTNECKTIARLFEQVKSTPSQIAEDKIAEAIEAAQQTDTYKDVEKAMKDGYDSLKDAMDKFGTPKK